MTGLLAHDEAERLRSAIADALSGLLGDSTHCLLYTSDAADE